MMVLPSDHLIQDEASFRKVLLTSCSAAEASEALVTIGIKPNWACPSYGYVERADRERYAGCAEDVAIYSVRRFREKPAPALAQSFLDEGTFTWNAGMFIWTVPAVRQALSQHAPVLDRFIANLQQSGDFNATFQAEFPELPKLSIDYALMEKASRVLNVEATFDWDDVGNWTSVAKYLLQTDEGNQHKGQLSQHSSRNNIVFSQTQQRVALLGVEDLIVVAVEDAILVTTKANAENIKELANELPVHLR
jgi:mannose-1-phosphate guanylyltransferase